VDRRQALRWLGGLSTFLLPIPATQGAVAEQGKSMQLVKSKSEWAALLPPPAYRVLFEEETERAGTSPLNNEKRDGTFERRGSTSS
jgi:peptide-methionine (R)-S-oxide reductase